MQGFPNGDIGGQANLSPPPLRAIFFHKVGLEKLFICRHPADPTLEVSTIKHIFLELKSISKGN